MRKLLTAAGLTSSAVALGVLFAGPAAAWTASAQFDVVFPGQKPQTTYYVENTGAQTTSNGNMTGKSVVYWQLGVDQVIDASKRFTSFKITTRVEARLGKSAEDEVITKKTCDMTAIINDHYAWSYDSPDNTCVAPSATYDGELWWSSDATVVYDIEGDGKGAITQELPGTQLVHG
ncbi:hypothetical protein ADK65_14180 [Streptomyces sp. NRRL B-1140]|uniref:hypothetical protein n=1 Tax=Streptomyces sp. NRRL B-1140 TaxID=1415549 RepID=UPI0006ADEA5B|nr:hypothetical protein [Streptomyces sp. NRRL B-1140]KOX00754.1 hypothetical protein ADK65_14180 [Streptomyces sp. NRRL B-1140]